MSDVCNFVSATTSSWCSPFSFFSLSIQLHTFFTDVVPSQYPVTLISLLSLSFTCMLCSLLSFSSGIHPPFPLLHFLGLQSPVSLILLSISLVACLPVSSLSPFVLHAPSFLFVSIVYSAAFSLSPLFFSVTDTAFLSLAYISPHSITRPSFSCSMARLPCLFCTKPVIYG